MKWEGLFGITSGRFAASAALAAFGMLGSLFAYAVGGSWTVCDSGRFAIESASFGVSFFVFAALLYSPVVVVLVRRWPPSSDFPARHHDRVGTRCWRFSA